MRVARSECAQDAPAPGTAIGIFVTNQLAGYRGPCGRTKHEDCGMARWASLVEKRRRERPVLLIDTGDFSLPPGTGSREMKGRYFFEGMRLLNHDAVGIGESEIGTGLDEVSATAKKYRIPLVCANIIDRRLKRSPFPATIVRDVGGRRMLFGRKGAARVGIFSVALPGYIYATGADVSKNYFVVDPRLSALEAATNLRARGCDLIIAVSHLGWTKSLELAREVPGIDLVLKGHRSHDTVYVERPGSVVVVDTGPCERSFTELGITFAGDSLVVTSADVCSKALASKPAGIPQR